MISLRHGVFAGLLAGLAFTFAQGTFRLLGVSLPSELVADRVLPHVPVDAFLHLLDLMGGAQAAKQQALIGGWFGSVAVGGMMGGIYAVLLKRPVLARHPVRTLIAAALVAWVAMLVTLFPVFSASYLGLGPALAVAATAIAYLVAFGAFAAFLYMAAPWGTRAGPVPADDGRRRLMIGAVAGVLGLGTAGMATFLYRNSALGYDGMTYDGPVKALTPTQGFYTVTKNLIDPAVFEPAWRLDVLGKVARPATYQLSDLSNMSGCITQETTLECISNSVGRGLISNAAWHGIPLRRLLDAASPAAGAIGVTFRAVDGYVHTASLETAMADGTFLAWLMNGQPLPNRHGYPLRLLVPSAYGEVSVKWLTQIEVLDHEDAGYYETQGWQPRFVKTMSRIDFPKKDMTLKAGSSVQLQGIAYAADRGISRVEVSTDSGQSWTQAEITYGKPNTWSTWMAPWKPDRTGAVTLKVRATDGRGDPQSTVAHGFAPAGASGVHTIQVTVTS